MNALGYSGRNRAVFGISMLYLGKASGIIVNLVFIPFYSHALGPEGFGAVAVILSLQTLLLTLDLGMSILVGRDVAAAEFTPAKLLHQLFCAELGLVMFYGALLLAVGVLILAGLKLDVDWRTVLASVVLFLLLVLQNLHYSAIIARRAYTAASALQLVGNLTRAGGTAIVLTMVSPTVLAFVVTQAAGAALQALATRYLCLREFRSDPRWTPSIPTERLWASTRALFRRARSLALLSASGAAVTQLDKPIISVLMSTASVAPYYLAMTYCMVPMSILAGPVAQFFQPLVLNAVSAGDTARAARMMRRFTVALLCITLLPTAGLYLLRQPLVGAWLHDGPLVNETIQYSLILMPGLAIGALGFIPYTLLLATSDFRFQALMSAGMTILTLLAATLASSRQSVWSVCTIYAIYHAASTVLLWVRAAAKPEVRELARSSASLAALIILVIALATSVIDASSNPMSYLKP